MKSEDIRSANHVHTNVKVVAGPFKINALYATNQKTELFQMEDAHVSQDFMTMDPTHNVNPAKMTALHAYQQLPA